MTTDGLIRLTVKVLNQVHDKDWHKALELAEELVGALKVKSCLGSGE